MGLGSLSDKFEGKVSRPLFLVLALAMMSLGHLQVRRRASHQATLHRMYSPGSRVSWRTLLLWVCVCSSPAAAAVMWMPL